MSAVCRPAWRRLYSIYVGVGVWNLGWRQGGVSVSEGEGVGGCKTAEHYTDRRPARPARHLPSRPRMHS
jgi:hypothetical protein